MLLYLTLIFSLVTNTCAQFPSLEESPIDATAFEGASVTFDCTVRNLGAYNVLWLKRRNGQADYISRNWDIFGNSSKYLIHNDEMEPSFSLEIFNLEMSDAGVYECRYESRVENEFLGSATLTVEQVDISPRCQYVTVPSSTNGIVYDLNCVWSPSNANSPADILKNGNVIPVDFRLSDRVISRQTLDRSDQLNDFECRWTSPITGQMNTCRYQQSAQAPIILGVEPYRNGVTVGETARFECQAEMASSMINQDITYSWSITKNGQVVDLGERQKGLMKQAMRILSAELTDDGLTVMCTASSLDGVVHGGGLLAVFLPTSTSTQPTSKPMTIRVGSSIAPRIDKPFILNPTIMSVISVLLVLILALIVVIIVLAKSKTRRDKWIAMGRGMSMKKNRTKRDPHFDDEAHLRSGYEMTYPDQNPDIIRAHSTSPPIYAMPDKLNKSNTMDTRQPPRHYIPRRQSVPEFKETGFVGQTSDMRPSETYPNPYEDIDDEAVNDAKQMRSKSHTVSQFYRDSNSSSLAESPRRYRGMKAAVSASMLYGKPDKPARNPKGLSLKSRKSWDQPGSIENLCKYAVSDTKSVTGSICDGDSYACVDDMEGITMTSDYMDMNSVALDESNLEDSNNITKESELSAYDVIPLYAQIEH